MCLWALILDKDKHHHNSYRYCFSAHDKRIIVDHCKETKECITEMSKRNYDLIFLDSDINKNSESEIAYWISQNPTNIEKTKIFIHTEDPMKKIPLISGAKYISFAWDNPS